MSQTAFAPGSAAPAADGGWGVPGVGVVSESSSGQGCGGSGSGSGEPPSGHPVCAAVLTCLEAIEGVPGTGVATLRPAEIRLMLLAVVQLIAGLFALKMRLLVVGHAQRIEDLTGATSTVAFVSHLTRTRRATASMEMRLAKDLDRRYPLLADALARGLMSPEHVAVAVRALRKLPRDLDPAKLEACQRVLIDAAQEMDPAQLRAVGRKLWEVIDPDGADAKAGKDLEDEEELARAKAFFQSWRNGDGTTGFRGKLPDVQADMLIKALQAFAAPRRRSNPNIPTSQPDDVRPEDADLASGPEDAGEDSAPGDSCERSGPEDACGDSGAAGTDAEGDEPAESIEDVVADESPEEQETGRTIPYPVRLGHALMDLLERLPSKFLPSSGGVSATVMVTMTLAELEGRNGVAMLDTGTPISASQARRFACEAKLIPVVLDGESVPLDLGRSQRIYHEYQRQAMAVRDKKCVIEGCDRPAAWCHAHHFEEWEKGGPTDLASGGLVCPYHHSLLNSPKWRVEWVNGKPRLRRIYTA